MSLDHFGVHHCGARNEGGEQEKGAGIWREGEGLLGMSARTVFKKRRNVVRPREGHVKQKRFRLFGAKLDPATQQFNFQCY